MDDTNTIYEANTKMLICIFVFDFACAKSRFPHDEAHLTVKVLEYMSLVVIKPVFGVSDANQAVQP